MKRLLAIFLFATPLLGQGQSAPNLPILLATSSSTNTAQAENKLTRFVESFQRDRTISDITLLKKVFHQTQKTFLNEYVSYSGFGEIFEKGKYDCLTATSLFSIILDRLEFEYSVVETNYHIFLLVKTSKGEVLLETTDRIDGFVRNEKEIQERIGKYRNGITTENENKNVYQYSFDLYHTLSPSKLPGLLYYNQAVKAYNLGDLENSVSLLLKSHSIYETPRITEFSYILLNSVVKSDLSESDKQRIISQFKNLPSRKSAVLAAR